MSNVNIQSIKKGDTEIVSRGDNIFQLEVNRTKMMWEDFTYLQSLKEFAEQIEIAEGAVICTGLGFLLREAELLKKKEVKSVTVIEINQDVIDIQNELNPKIMNQLNVICADADTYKGECDTLLLDHWADPAPNEDTKEWLKKINTRVESICKNIKHKKMAFWPPKQLMEKHESERKNKTR